MERSAFPNYAQNGESGGASCQWRTCGRRVTLQLRAPGTARTTDPAGPRPGGGRVSEFSAH